MTYVSTVISGNDHFCRKYLSAVLPRGRLDDPRVAAAADKDTVGREIPCLISNSFSTSLHKCEGSTIISLLEPLYSKRTSRRSSIMLCSCGHLSRHVQSSVARA